jgi:glycosyltransferase involved in cell wall biosynthesis
LPIEQNKRVLVAVEQRYRRDPDQRVYSHGPSKYAMWTSYLDVFDEVVVVARMATSEDRATSGARADGPSVSFDALPDYRGPWQYLRHLRELTDRARHSIEQCHAYILRVPGLVGRLVWKELRKLGRPYALEVVGDPWDALGPECVRVAFRPILRRAAVRDLRAMCQGAMAVHYVTRVSLQRRYPPAKGAYAVGFSDAVADAPFASASDLDKRCAQLRSAGPGGRPVRLGFLGSLAQLYKGLEVLLHAVSLCRARGVDAEIFVAGEGRYLEEMKSAARRLGIEDRTRFLGQLPFGKAVFDFLDSVDLFVLPSHAEGLPRALLEAMARGCPCIGTNVGGIPELLPSKDIVPAGDPVALAGKIAEVVGDHARLIEMAQRNSDKVKEFSPEVLARARRDFCRFVRAHTRSA